MIDYFKKRKREREILHECLETLVQEYEYRVRRVNWLYM